MVEETNQPDASVSLLARRHGVGPLAPNHKRVWLVKEAHGLLLLRHAGEEQRRHDGRIMVDQRNRRWCSDGFEISCDNGERVRVAFALDCCDREAMSFVATTAGIGCDDVRNLMLAAVGHRFGLVLQLPRTIQWRPTTATATSPATSGNSPATSAWNRGPGGCRVSRATAWRRLSRARSNAITPG